MAGFTLQHGRIDQSVRVDTTHAKAVNAMAGTTILSISINPGHDRMPNGLIRSIDPATAGIMTGITTLTRDSDIGMVGIRRCKSSGGMTGTAITGGVIVNNRRSLAD